jgi:hypothetical protein
MPKDEFDFDDPLELNGVALLTEEDTTDAMCECFIEEFMRMGYGHKQILALFRNPHYLGMNLVLEKRGEPFIRTAIVETFARWGRPVVWPAPIEQASGPAVPEPAASYQPPAAAADECAQNSNPILTDPMGAPIPNFNL